MRITNQMMTNNAIQHIEETQSRINVTQERISTGKMFQTPSEDPINASYSLQLKSMLTVSAGYQKTASLIKDWMTTTDSSLNQLKAVAVRAQNLVLGGINDTVDDNTRASALATELTEMINQTVDLGNTRFQDSYIFAGVSVDQPAFAWNSSSALEYKGISKAMLRTIGKDSKITLNINGDEAVLPLITALTNARDNLAAGQTTNLPSSLDAIKNALQSLITAQTANGARMRQVDATLAGLQKSDLGIQAILNEKEDTNLAEAYTILQSQETTYQAVLEVGSRATSALNLFDYMN